MVTRQPITPRVAEDNARGRLAGHGRRGARHRLHHPGPWAYGAPALAPHLTQGLYRAYHRYMAEYCAADSRRLKSMVLAPATDPAWSARVIEEHARDDWVAAVWPLLPEGLPVDDPDLEPIWAAAAAADLPIMYHALHHRDAVLPRLSRHLGQPGHGPLRRADVGRPAVPLVHAHGRHARPLSATCASARSERPRLAAALARAAHPADRLRARLRVAEARAHAGRVRPDGARLLQHRLLRGRRR